MQLAAVRSHAALYGAEAHSTLDEDQCETLLLSVPQRLDTISQHGEWIEEVLLPSWRTYCCLLRASDYFAFFF